MIEAEQIERLTAQDKLTCNKSNFTQLFSY